MTKTLTTIQKQLTLFGRCLAHQTLSFSNVNKQAIKCGYLIDERVCNTDVIGWVMKQSINYNATFYKEWSDVINKSRFELYIDQIAHYLSTYGTDYQGKPYIPNNGADVIPFTDLKVIMPITEEELIKKCVSMLNSGIALKEETIIDVLDILNELDYVMDITKVKNKEAKMHLYKLTGALPEDAEEMVRYLVFLTTGKTMVIKDKDTIAAIKANRVDVDHLIHQFGEAKLAQVFYRYKALFLAMRTGKLHKACINRLRRLAKTNHVPYTLGYFEQILSNPSLLPKLPEMLERLNNFKKVTLLQTIEVRRLELGMRPFVIRNQKLFMKEEKTLNKEYYTVIYQMIYMSLVESLRKKACRVKLSDIVELTLPTSEKSFVGNLPLGTSFPMSGTDAIVGINWKEVDGARDLDLKYIDINGKQVGWNANYYSSDKSIVYSGDMTSADPEATELLYASNGFTPAVIKVNTFSGSEKAKFKFFLGKEKNLNLRTRSMINPNSVIFETELEMTSKEMILGVITEDRFVVANFRTGEKRVAGESITNKYAQYSLDTRDCYLPLKKVLEDAGFILDNQQFDLDLSQIDKSSLISLLS